MPDYFTETSFTLKMDSQTDAEEARAFLDACAEHDLHYAVSLFSEWPRDAFGVTSFDDADGVDSDVYLEGGEHILHIYQMEYANIDFILDFLTALWIRFDRQDSITFTWSTSASKAVEGAFGGGGAMVFRDPSGKVDVDVVTTDDIIGTFRAKAPEKAA